MKRTITIALLAGAFAIAASAAPPPVRQAKQHARIVQGVRSGQLTPAETARLRHQEAQLHRQTVRNRLDGGGLTPAERARIQANANQNSRLIHRLKHNNRTR